jgi:hypothetical protein
MAKKVSDIYEDDRRRVFLHLEKMFKDEIKKNLHTQNIKTEIDGLYGIRISVEKDTFTREEVAFLLSLSSNNYVKKRLEIRISFFRNVHNSKGGVELYIVPSENLIAYYAKRLKYY